MENDVPRCAPPGLSILGRLLAEVSTPPVALLAPGAEVSSRTEHLAVYGLDAQRYAITRREYVDGQEQACTVHLYQDADRVRQALLGSPLERALCRLSPLHVVEDYRIAELEDSVADVRCSTWSAVLYGQALPYEEPDQRHNDWGYGRDWEGVMLGGKAPEDFFSLQELRRHLEEVLGTPGASCERSAYSPGSCEEFEDELKYYQEIREFDECMGECARVWWHWQQQEALRLIWTLRLAGPAPARR
ncbi:hypothetical protein [Deinococcus aerophilus]|uniref:Uncharacterized protein n=1 Tax=Deinococcus aerophilus TaxID=522488 RepID=A0ABQ2GXE4_9DEIO|nr:hypothetical protein [Deinococcus aerophilus]GGM16489.1 hypothetical protein GCM10010841_26030 [Deinococcus aerophilus]